MEYLVLVETLITLLIMIGPIGVIAPFLSLTDGMNERERSKILYKSIVFSFLVLVLAAFLGQIVLSTLGVSTFALQIAGGILFFKYGYEVMNGEDQNILNDSVGLVPLGFPMIAGPGSITALIVLSSQHTPPLYMVIAIFISLLITGIVLRYSTNLTNLIGKEATDAIMKIMGLLVITIGIQMVLSGVEYWFVQVQSSL